MSVVIVAFEGAPKVSQEAKEREAELDSRLELKVKGDVKILLHCLCLAMYGGTLHTASREISSMFVLLTVTL